MAIGDIEQLLDGGRDAAGRISDGRIAAPAVEPAARVDADDIAFDERPMGRNAVNDFFVDAGAGGGGKRRAAAVLMRIVFEQRLGAAEAKVLGDDGVDLGRGHAGRDDLAHELMRLPDADAGLAHQGDFAFGFELNHGERYENGLSRMRLTGWNLINLRQSYWRIASYWPHRRRCELWSKTSSGVPSAVDLPQNALAGGSSRSAAA